MCVLITFKETENIGDDIQSYSALRFLPKVDYYIEREALDLFVPEKKEQIITIMNGWFLHSKINFPISPYIFPIYISTHFSAYNSGGITTEYLDNTTSEMNRYGPIGCRDSGTMELLKSKGISNYFSGCMTLTIEKNPKVEKKDYICIVDIEEEAEKYLKENLKGKETIIKRTHVLDKEKNKKLSWDRRFKNVRELLDTYQAAKLVITSRLHCALPCLALGTPVLLLYDENKEYTKDRLVDYTKKVNHMSTEEFLTFGISKIKSGIKNPKDHLEIRTSIEERITTELIKVNKSKFDNNLPEVEDYKKLYVQKKEKFDRLYKTATDELKNYINLRYEKEYWKREFEVLLSKVNHTQYNEQKIELHSLLEKYEELLHENVALNKKIQKYERRTK